MRTERIPAAALAIALAIPWASAAGGLPSLDEIAEAHGALEAIDVYAARIVRTAPGPTPGENAPARWRCLRLSLARGQLAYLEWDPGAPEAAVLHRSGAGGGWRADLERGRIRAVSPDGHAGAWHRALPLSPVLTVRELLAHPEAVSGPLPDEEPLARFSYRAGNGTIYVLWFDTRTRLLRRLQQNGLSVSYDEYETAQGYPVSRSMRLTSEAGTGYRVRVTGVSFEAPFPDHLVAPEGRRSLASDDSWSPNIWPAHGAGRDTRRRLAKALCPP